MCLSLPSCRPADSQLTGTPLDTTCAQPCCPTTTATWAPSPSDRPTNKSKVVFHLSEHKTRGHALSKLSILSASGVIDPSEEDKVVVRTCLDLPHGCVVVQLQGGCECRADSANSGTCSHSPTGAATTLNMDGLCMK